MVTQATCPDPDVIRELLRGELPEHEHDELSLHFDLCSDCRQRFDAEASMPDYLADAARLCAAPVWQRDSATLDRLLRDMPGQLSSAADAASVAIWSADAMTDYLEPSDNAEHLGRLGSYEIIEVIGRGGMGIVLRGIDSKLNRVVAIKVLAPELASNPNARRRFFREGQAAAAVSHDHVVTIHAVDDAERLPYLVMEFVAGESLEECVRRSGPLSVESILRIGRQTALGLAAAHEVGLVHRDMKPANILLENGIQRVRITDFGLARAVDDVAITQSGSVSGTPLYMSPEQASGEHVDHRSDLFSLGSVLYMMCTGRPAFRAQTTVAVIRRVCDDTPRPIREINADIPDWLADIIDRLISKQPDDRFQTAAEVADLLGGHLAHLQDPENVPAPAAVTPEASRKKTATRPQRVLLLVALLLGIFTLGVTEAAGITHVSEFLGIVLKLKTSEGTLVIEIEDPNVKVSIDGDEVVIDGVGVHELRLKPGKHQFTTARNGAPASQEWVTIERGGKKVLRILRLPPEKGVDQPVGGGDSPTPGDGDIQYRPSVDGVAFETNVRLQRFGNQSVVVAPGLGKLIFPSVPEQLFGQRCAMAEVEGGRLTFKVQDRSFGGDAFQFVPRHGASPRQRLWLLVPEANWGTGAADDGFAYDTRESLAKRNWHAWRTLTSYHTTTDPADEANHVKWAVFYRDADPNESVSIRTHPSHTPMLVWGSLLVNDILIDAQWDQRVSVFNPGASVSLGNGHHIFDEVPEFLAGRLYTKRSGYQGFVRFRVERDQRVVVGMYDWRAMNDGNASGGWKEELTPPDMLKKTGWEEVATLQPRHTHANGSATWHFYARDCKRGETFILRSHKYQAPIVISERPAGLNAPESEGIEFRLPTATDIERRIVELVVEFNRLFKERRFAEALVVAKQARELDPGNAACITMMLKAGHAMRGHGAETIPQEPGSSPKTTQTSAAIKLDPAGITTGIAPAVGEPAVYGVGSPVTTLREFRVFFEARAQGRHSNGARKLIGQIPGPVQPGDAISVERFERTGGLIRLRLRHELNPERVHEPVAPRGLENLDLHEEVRRLTVRYEKARMRQPNQKEVSEWLLIIARHMIARADMETDANEIRKLREQARERVTNARKLFAAEVADSATAYEAFPVFIDSTKDPNVHSRKTRAEIRYVSAQLQLATCTMVEALSHPLDSDERADRLNAAAGEFETVYRKYRTQLGGLFARVQQGRCLQFLGKPEAALGIYSELLAYPGTSDSMLRVQNRTLLFTLISLNDERNDWAGVIARASKWFEKAPVEQRRSSAGAGILWEEARAMRGAGEDTPVRLLPELIADNDSELILRATLKLLRQVERSGGQHSAQAGRRIPHVLHLLDNNAEGVPGDATGQSVYFQVPLPEIPTGTYQVLVTLETDAAVEAPSFVSGRFTVPGTYITGAQLTLLATHAIVMPESADTVGLTSATQSPHGLDLTAILESTDQRVSLKSFPAENSQFEQSCAMLRTKGMKWALCELLNHPNVDAKVYAARELGRMEDADTVAVLLAAAKRNDYDVNGSESATIHSIYRQALKKALEATTGLKLTPGGLSYITLENGESVRFTSRKSPELFPENVDFERVEAWLRDVYLPKSGDQINPLSLEKAETGLIGRVEVDGRDGGILFHYRHARLFVHEDVPETIHDSKGFTVTLEGYVVVPRDMVVQVWQAGGGVSHDNNWLHLDDTQLCVTGDNHDKHYKADLPLLKGLHHVRWELTGGTFRANILFFLDPESGELLPLINKGEASIRRSPDETRIEIKGEKLDWPIKTEWLPRFIQKLNSLGDFEEKPAA